MTIGCCQSLPPNCPACRTNGGLCSRNRRFTACSPDLRLFKKQIICKKTSGPSERQQQVRRIFVNRQTLARGRWDRQARFRVTQRDRRENSCGLSPDGAELADRRCVLLPSVWDGRIPMLRSSLPRDRRRQAGHCRGTRSTAFE